MRRVLVAARLQLALFRHSLGRIAILVAIPFYVLIFLSITRYHGRTDLDLPAVLAPALAGMWTLALTLAGDVIAGDKRWGVLELMLASPTRLFPVILGRTGMVGILGVVCVVESWLVGVVGFRVDSSVAHPLWCVAGFAATLFAMAGTSTVMAALFVLGRSALNFQNALTYPFYLLGGVFVSVSFLPGWLRPLSAAVFLSWSSDLLRDSLTAPVLSDPARRIGVIVGLGLAGLLVGAALQAFVVRRVRVTGAILS